ncbi:MAG: hypothetical protein PVS3B1_12600 [Ktedonobacteraceae bacterium]
MKETLAQDKLYDNDQVNIAHFPLRGLLLEGQLLALHSTTRSLSLLAEGPELLEQQQFSDSEFRVLKAVLQAFPYYCPYEVLLASITTHSINTSTVNHSRRKLQEAQSQGEWRQELRPIRRAISSLRTKLHTFQLEISIVREGGCSLTRLTSSI